MNRLNVLLVGFVLVSMLGCSGEMPTSLSDNNDFSAVLSKGDNGAQVYRAMSGDDAVLFVDAKNDLMMFAYGNDATAEAIFELYDVHCDLPPADVQSELMNVTNPSNDSGMWRFRGTSALAIFDYDAPLVFPPPGGIHCAEHALVAHGVVDAYREIGNDFWFGADRTLTFGLKARGTIQNAMIPGEVEVHINARGMYRFSDIQRGVFNSLTRNTNIRLSPDPRD